MTRPLLQEITLKNFRCFGNEQKARLAPLTLLVGDNSTGKTSFLAAIRAVCETGQHHSEPDFRQPPYDLGSYWEIAHSRGKQGVSSSSFEIGFEATGIHSDDAFRFDVTFKADVVEPTPALLSWCRGEMWIKCDLTEDEEIRIDFGSSVNTWRLINDRLRRHGMYRGRMALLEIDRLYELRVEDSVIERVEGSREFPDNVFIDRLDGLVMDISSRSYGPVFASAPIRSHPLRTYDHTRQSPDPEGAYVPSYFANVRIKNRQEWHDLKSKLEGFGRVSGLYDEVFVSQLGTSAAGPFQVEITSQGGPRRNLIDVGYGVSQVLPVLAELFRRDGPAMFLFQQPEVHLHPSAQAALGSVFCATAASGRQLVIETHSDYIVDRILLDIRDNRTSLTAEDVSILYFEREDLNVSIHSIRIDGEGNVLDPPRGYRSFFQDELKRVIDY